MSIFDKYIQPCAKYYRRLLDAKIDKRPFEEKPPAKDWNETFDRTSTRVQRLVDKFEGKLLTFGGKIDKKMEEKGWKDKFKGYVNKYTNRNGTNSS